MHEGSYLAEVLYIDRIMGTRNKSDYNMIQGMVKHTDMGAGR